MEKLIMLTLKFKANLRSSMSNLLASSTMTTMEFLRRCQGKRAKTPYKNIADRIYK